jgi:hypothetical protein
VDLFTPEVLSVGIAPSYGGAGGRLGVHGGLCRVDQRDGGRLLQLQQQARVLVLDQVAHILPRGEGEVTRCGHKGDLQSRTMRNPSYS